MLSKNEHKLIWKEVSPGVEVTHFPSVFQKQQIYLKKVKAQKSSKNPLTIFLFHDLAAYHGRFNSLVSWFRVQHPHVSFIMMDFIGHGLSSGTRGHIAHFNDLVNDAANVFSSIEKKDNEMWVAMGHGLGALCLLDLLNYFDDVLKNKIDRTVLSNFFLSFPSTILQLQNKLFESFSPLESALKTSRPLEIYLPDEVLTDTKEQSLYLEDPLMIRKPTYQTLKVLSVKVKSIFQDAYFLDKPTLLLKSESPYLLTRGMDSFSKGLKKGILTEKKYSNMKHDLYNERDNNTVFMDIADWISS